MLSTVGAGTLLVTGFFMFLAQLPVTGDTPKQVPAVDGLVVFTGGKGRVEAGMGLILKGFNGPVLVTGVNERVSREALLSGFGLSPEQSSRIDLDYKALTTKGNVAMTTHWAEQKNLRRIGLVTEYYHMPRSLVLFGRSTPRLEVEALPVFGSGGSPGVLAREYIKYLYTLLPVPAPG